VSIRFKSFTP